MFKRFKLASAICLLLVHLAPLSSIEGQSADVIRSTGVSNGDLFIYTASESINLTQDRDGKVDQIALHGNVLAFTRRDNREIQNLWLSINGESPFVLVDDVDPLYPFSFTADGQILFSQNTHPSPDGRFISDIFAIDPASEAMPRAIAQLDSTIALSPGCGGGSPLPTDWQYWTEAGFGGYHRTLSMTPYGIVYSLGCLGERTAILDIETSEIRELGDNFGNVVLSPDRNQLAGIVFNSATPEIQPQLAIVDLKDQTMRLFATAAVPDQVIWSSDGESVFYTVYESRSDSIPMTADEEAALQQFFGSPGGAAIGFPLYRVEIHHYAPETNADELVYTAPNDIASIGRLFAVDETTLIFSQIPNLKLWITAIAEGQFDPSSSYDTSQLQLETVPVTVLSLDLKTDHVMEVGKDINLYTPAG
jgi:hypothetical protein